MLIAPIRSFDPSSISHNIVWILIGWALGKGLDSIFKQPLKFNRNKFRKNFGWFKISCYLISFLIAGYFMEFFEKLRLKPLQKLSWGIMFYDLIHGFYVLYSLEPDIAKYIFDQLEKLVQKTHRKD